MADINRSPYVKSPYSLRQIIQASYRSPFNNRFKNAERDVKHRARVESVIIWRVHYVEGVPEREKVHTYRVIVVSVNEKNEVSSYPVRINVDYLSIDAPAKLRCGSLSKYTDKYSVTSNVASITPTPHAVQNPTDQYFNGDSSPPTQANKVPENIPGSPIKIKAHRIVSRTHGLSRK